jgi:hypothetical protein
VLVAVLHLDHVALELGSASTREIRFVVLPRVARVLRPTHRLRPRRAAPSLRDLIHLVRPTLTRAVRLSITKNHTALAASTRPEGQSSRSLGERLLVTYGLDP